MPGVDSLDAHSDPPPGHSERDDEWPAEPPSPAPRDLLNLDVEGDIMEARIRANLGLLQATSNERARSLVYEENVGAAWSSLLVAEMPVEPLESLPLDTQSWERWQESEREKSLVRVASHLRSCPQAETWHVNVRVPATIGTNGSPPVIVCGCGKRWQPSRNADRFLDLSQTVIRETLDKLLAKKPATVWALILEEEQET